MFEQAIEGTVKLNSLGKGWNGHSKFPNPSSYDNRQIGIKRTYGEAQSIRIDHPSHRHAQVTRATAPVNPPFPNAGRDARCPGRARGF